MARETARSRKLRLALPKNSLSIEPSRLILGARTPSSAQRASARSHPSKEICWQRSSRYALSADEGVRVPSNSRLISLGYDLLGKAALHGIQDDNLSSRLIA